MTHTHTHTHKHTRPSRLPVPLDVLWVGGAEHQGLALLFRGHTRRAHQATHLWLEAHVQHAVGLVHHQVAQLGQTHLGTTTNESGEGITGYLKIHGLDTDDIKIVMINKL